MQTAIVTGGSRGLGRGIVRTLAAEGMRVIAVARNVDDLAALKSEIDGSVETIAADIADPIATSRIMQETLPDALVLNAGARPLMRPIHTHTWESFSVNWETDVKAAFLWTREAMTLPLRPGSKVIIGSSGAALGGSPWSGGYSGAKAMLMMMARFLNEESAALGLGIDFRAILPTLTPETELGMGGVAGYARRQGITVDEFKAQFDPPLTPDMVGQHVLELLNGAGPEGIAFKIDAAGMQPVG